MARKTNIRTKCFSIVYLAWSHKLAVTIILQEKHLSNTVHYCVLFCLYPNLWTLCAKRFHNNFEKSLILGNSKHMFVKLFANKKDLLTLFLVRMSSGIWLTSKVNTFSSFLESSWHNRGCLEPTLVSTEGQGEHFLPKMKNVPNPNCCILTFWGC